MRGLTLLCEAIHTPEKKSPAALHCEDVSDFEPTTDFPESIDDDDTPMVSAAHLRDAKIQSRRKNVLRWLILGAGLLLIPRYGFVRVIIALVFAYAILVLGMAVIGSFARPVPEPPPPGELRKVKLTYRCPTCGAELRMTLANDQVPSPPRHCSDEMELTTNLEEI